MGRQYTSIDHHRIANLAYVIGKPEAPGLRPPIRESSH